MNPKSAPSRAKKNPDAPPRKELFLKGFLCTLVCLWMFILGLLVGRGTAPVRFDIERLQDKLAALKSATVDETTEHYRVAFQELDQELDLGFHEALKSEAADIPATLAPASDPAPAPASPQTAAATGPGEGSEEKTAAAIPKKTRGSEFRKPQGQTAAVWTIQVAATQDEAHGKKLLLTLYQMGFKAYLTKVAIPGKGTWYRVRIGEYASREAAETDVARLEEKRYSPMIIAP